MITYLYALVILGLTLIGHIAGMRGLYVMFRSYDIFVHLLGGIGIGFFIAALIAAHAPQTRKRRLIIVIGVLISGIIWELFEMRFNLAGYRLWTQAYYLDTAKDLLNDVIGGSLVAFLYKKNNQSPNKQ